MSQAINQTRNFVFVNDTEVQCTKCNRIVLYVNLPYIRSKTDGRRLSYCTKCRYKQVWKSSHSSPEKFFHERELSIQKRLAKNDQPLNTPRRYNLRPGYLVRLWEKQEERCFYTGQLLQLEERNIGFPPTSVVIDRVNNNYGYLETNVVITSRRINSMKADLTLDEMKLFLPKWHQKIVFDMNSLHEDVLHGFS